MERTAGSHSFHLPEVLTQLRRRSLQAPCSQSVYGGEDGRRKTHLSTLRAGDQDRILEGNFPTQIGHRAESRSSLLRGQAQGQDVLILPSIILCLTRPKVSFPFP